MLSNAVAFLVYGEPGSGRNALTEEKYRDLANAFSDRGFAVKSVLYNDGVIDQFPNDLPRFKAVLVWVNPIEQGKDRRKLDALLLEISQKGCLVSTHPEVILKIGTKEVLYDTRDMDWGGDIKIYRNYTDFRNTFPGSLQASKKRILKQYRGNGGNGVYKVTADPADQNKIRIMHAKENDEVILTLPGFYEYFAPYFLNNGLLIDQPHNENLANGMVRCYLVGSKVAGFGYQEINALYETAGGNTISPGKRYYFTELCGIFADLKDKMERDWVPQLQQKFSIPGNILPVIWDADFFINSTSPSPFGKYTLCEINVSCVSPFPPSSISFIINEVSKRIGV